MNRFLSIFLGLILISCSEVTQKTEKLPNIILILTDDQAYGDLSINQNPYLETPNIDLLAQTGMLATHFYVSPVCAPTRASLLTGRYHQRTGVTGVTRGREDMNLNETTMADVLKSFGYQTGIFGKWHNGAHYPYHPLGRGFDQFVGFTSGHWSNYFDTTIEKNGKDFQTQGYLTDVLTDEALEFIEQNHKNDQPFFSMITYQTPHTPLQVPDQYFDKYKAKGVDDFNATIYGMVENIDYNLGRLQDKIKALNIEENTIIVYLSDNGPLNLRFNQGLKGRKGSVDQGGVRVPMIINWKDHIEANTVVEQPLAHIDILPTLLDLVKKDYTFKNKLDGLSFASLLEQKIDPVFNERILFQEWSGNKRAIQGDFLMVNESLFDLAKDPGQKTDVKDQHLTIYNELNQQFKNWFASLQTSNVGKKYIPVGYDDFPKSILPAHEANLYPPFEFRKDRKHTGIAYHSLHGWAHDWVDFWTKTEAYASWDVDLIEDGTFDVYLKYALEEENANTKLLLTIGQQELNIENLPPFEHSTFQDHDRVKRTQEAPETDWNRVKVGSVKLKKGKKEMSLKALEIPGGKSIELKEIHLVKQTH